MITANLADWVARWGIPYEAMVDLAQRLNVSPAPVQAPFQASEAWAQSHARLQAAYGGHMLWRNNVGSLQDKTGRWVRYGLANESAKENEAIKSADLIGIYRLRITPEMVGQIVGQFWSLEAKEPGWSYTGQGREPAQAAWAQLVTINGGRAEFTTGAIR